jgi:hypothetical protein
MKSIYCCKCEKVISGIYVSGIEKKPICWACHKKHSSIAMKCFLCGGEAWFIVPSFFGLALEETNKPLCFKCFKKELDKKRKENGNV